MSGQLVPLRYNEAAFSAAIRGMTPLQLDALEAILLSLKGTTSPFDPVQLAEEIKTLGARGLRALIERPLPSSSGAAGARHFDPRNYEFKRLIGWSEKRIREEHDQRVDRMHELMARGVPEEQAWERAGSYWAAMPNPHRSNHHA